MNCVSLYCCVKLQTDIQIERSITYRFISSCHLLYFLYLATYTNTRIQNTSWTTTTKILHHPMFLDTITSPTSPSTNSNNTTSSPNTVPAYLNPHPPAAAVTPQSTPSPFADPSQIPKFYAKLAVNDATATWNTDPPKHRHNHPSHKLWTGLTLEQSHPLRTKERVDLAGRLVPLLLLRGRGMWKRMMGWMMEVLGWLVWVSSSCWIVIWWIMRVWVDCELEFCVMGLLLLICL